MRVVENGVGQGRPGPRFGVVHGHPPSKELFFRYRESPRWESSRRGSTGLKGVGSNPGPFWKRELDQKPLVAGDLSNALRTGTPLTPPK